MKLFTQITLILVIFLKTGNLLSGNDLFSVNNILLEQKDNNSSKQLANQAIKNGFNQLIERVLLKEDISKFSDLSFSNKKELVAYYNISKKQKEEGDKINFSVTFDKEKIHNLFYKKNVSYSDISDKEFYILPILIENDEIYIFSNNFYYQNWNNISEKKDLIEFVLPLENIEIIQNIDQFRNNLLGLELDLIFKEYLNKNVSLVLIEHSNSSVQKVYLKARIQNKILSKSLSLKKVNLAKDKFNEKMIFEIKGELENLIKSQNLIDIRTPSFLNVKLNLNKDNNLVLLNSAIKKIDLIENIFVLEFNKDFVNLKIKYLGKLEKIINQLKNEKIDLKFMNDQWLIKIL
tara:strand:+ start:2092 stop:3135 length:1044 start_codon:yes stop_codon:yes gene_type:complete